MKRSRLPLLAILVYLSLGSGDVFVGCGSGVNGSAGFACQHSAEEDPCDYIVTVEVTVLAAADDSPQQAATVTIGSDPPDTVNTVTTDEDGRAFWDDTSFITGFSAECGGRSVGTVEPYDTETSFTHGVIVSAQGFAPVSTVFSIDRDTRDVELTVRMGM